MTVGASRSPTSIAGPLRQVEPSGSTRSATATRRRRRSTGRELKRLEQRLERRAPALDLDPVGEGLGRADLAGQQLDQRGRLAGEHQIGLGQRALADLEAPVDDAEVAGVGLACAQLTADLGVLRSRWLSRLVPIPESASIRSLNRLGPTNSSRTISSDQRLPTMSSALANAHA